MKKNVPKFVLAKNEAAAPGNTYIVHTQEPSFIAEIKEFAQETEKLSYTNEHSDREFFDVSPLVTIEIKKYLDSADRQEKREFLAKRLRHWTIANFLVKNALIAG